MLKTSGASQLGLEGIDQQDFDKFQLVAGCFPYQIGLQARLPGKVIERVSFSPVGSIYVFYMVLGRFYTFVQYSNDGSITELEIPPWTLPGLPPPDDLWYDDFTGYEVGLISRLWGGGIWAIGIGVCETIIGGWIDPFSVAGTVVQVPYDPGLPNPGPDVPPPPPPLNPVLPLHYHRKPQDCDELPDKPYNDYAIADFFFQQDAYGGYGATGETEGPAFIWIDGPFGPIYVQVGGYGPPGYIAHPYDLGVTTDSGADCEERTSQLAYWNGAAWVQRSNSQGTMQTWYFDLLTKLSAIYPDGAPVGLRFFLVGTKTLTDGTGSIFAATLITTCACLEFGNEGSFYGQIDMYAKNGVDVGYVTGDTLVTATSLINIGSVKYNVVRVFQP